MRSFGGITILIVICTVIIVLASQQPFHQPVDDLPFLHRAGKDTNRLERKKDSAIVEKNTSYSEETGIAEQAIASEGACCPIVFLFSKPIIF
jgi:hypothetical protein